ncbi:MAG: hypothetical protein M1827_004999 [Pycnora praestabilis]|nr:MAG: hypothetical protein M1827_004999 [Pycnora praestabilis]
MARNKKRHHKSSDDDFTDPVAPPRPKNKEMTTAPNITRRRPGVLEGNADAEDVKMKKTESQQFLAMSRESKRARAEKKDEYLETFRKMTEKAEVGVLEMIKDKERTMVEGEEEFQGIFREILNRALTPSNSKSRRIKIPERAKSQDHPFYERGRSALKLAKGLIAEYESLSGVIDTQRSSVGEGYGWRENMEKVQRLLDVGKRVAEGRIEVIIKKQGQDFRAGGVHEGIEEEEEYRSTLADMGLEVAGTGNDGTTWERTVKDVGKGVRRMVRHLPVDE